VWSFRPLIEKNPEVLWAFLEAMARRVREVEARSSGLQQQ
jgi:CRP-like cAMP-binding protein